jgi:hypothetical protein
MILVEFYLRAPFFGWILTWEALLCHQYNTLKWQHNVVFRPKHFNCDQFNIFSVHSPVWWNTES